MYMYKVVAITSSKRKKNTYKVVSEVKEILSQNDIQVEVVNLYDYNIETCIGCEVCLLKGKCVLKDDVTILIDLIKESDGVILSSPVYLENVSGELKTFIDRTCMWFHRPELYGKPILVVATTKGSGLKSTVDYLQSVGVQWGMMSTGKIGRNIRTIENKVTEKECEKFIQYVKLDKSKLVPSLKSIVNFQVQKVLAGGFVDLDQVYWEEKGWDKEIYYFNCKINFIKKLAGKSMYKFLNRVVNK